MAVQLLDVVTRHNWKKYTPDGVHTYCLGQAVAVCEMHGSVGVVARMAVTADVIQRLFPERVTAQKVNVLGACGIVIGFNDHPDTTWYDIEKVCRACVEEAEANGEHSG